MKSDANGISYYPDYVESSLAPHQTDSAYNYEYIKSPAKTIPLADYNHQLLLQIIERLDKIIKKLDE